jgi:signal transduction histidine kinase
MKLQSKLALFNALSKALIILLFIASMPLVIGNVALLNTDVRLKEKRDKVLAIVDSVGISSFVEASESSSYGSYNLLKEEFISLEQISDILPENNIENSQRVVDGEVVDYRVLSHIFTIDGHSYLLEVGRSLSTITETESTLRRFAIFFMIAIVLLSSLTDIGFTKILLKPLDTIISTKLKNTSNPFQFNHQRVQTSTADFRYLDDSIGEMMAKIEAAFSKEREFIGNASHELLTPVSILQNKLENLMDDPSLSEDSMVKVAESQKTLSRLKNIIKTLLLISRIENEQFLKEETTDLQELLDEVTEQISDRVTARDISMKVDIRDNIMLEKSNRSLLFTMIFNLVNNAIKYNKSGGEILVRGYFKDSDYILEINDTGIGMEAEHIPHIFNRFKKLSANDNESFGLGLPIVNTIAAFHQVEIKVQSIPGVGSSFKLHFQKVKRAALV